ncbi:dihydrolipoamide acetyltransferase component of pyruvate dehydrogenase complex [Dictyobacter alpinus]|uniref:Dihydrolipoamide acetyltransferase component of pyruvate dehydrogenase complex n=1 Tax=Dictyobacter alpinus TaxID=2014873 RepID=A0A402B803_9CHLR|nr:dihydrolipoamide acetyltransferase family protein [Dictyobacter alpinus]GCE27447.1 dihydrolipoamide acetyltransferase component of pyruvate dehydrogenase complex [Dictyobacter alpinus]
MAEVNMPRLSDTMQEGTITHWLKKPGDEVKKGEVVAEVETDKANMEIEAFSSGVLEQILVAEGETAPIGQPIAILGTGANVQAQKQAATPQVVSTPAQQPVAANNLSSNVQSRPAVESAPEQNGRVNGGAIKSSPLARRMAEEHSIDLQQIKGTGPGGRIVRDDIEDYIEQQRNTAASTQPTPTPTVAAPVAASAPAPISQREVAPEDAEVVTLSTMQKTIARRLTESKQMVPHFYIGSDIDLTETLEMRQKLNANAGEGGVKVSVNDLIIKACALALEKSPEVNGSYRDGQFILHKHVNIGIAVDIPAGLIVPVIRDANLKGLRTIAREAKSLVAKAQAGKLTPAELDGGTFSISNLGMMDVTDFSAVINPPQSAILAVAAARKTFVPIDNQPVIRDIMHVTLSADHRILYGATVARFLQEVKRILQNPYLLLG